jgi:DNA invertase Pin-like site-specific DNA recombinase
MPTVAVYARVSTRGQDLAAQLEELRAYAARRSSDVLEFTDHGISGKKGSRPGLDALRATVCRREVEAVVCTELSRLARSTRDLCNLAAELEALGVALVVTRQAIDSSTPAGRFLFHALAAVAEFERDLIAQRTAAAVAHARAQGRRPGRRPALVGERLARARRLHRAGRSVREIAQVLGVSKSVVHRALAA